MAETQDARDADGTSVPFGTAPNWVNLNNVHTQNTTYTNSNWTSIFSSLNTDKLELHIDDFTITDAVSITIFIRGKVSSTSGVGLIFFRFSDDGSDWSTCTTHAMSAFGTSDATRNATCSHFGDLNGTQLDAMKVRIWMDSLTGTTTKNYQIDHVTVRANEPVVGYSHNVAQVPTGNINFVSRVPTANIAQVSQLAT